MQDGGAVGYPVAHWRRQRCRIMKYVGALRFREVFLTTWRRGASIPKELPIDASPHPSTEYYLSSAGVWAETFTLRLCFSDLTQLRLLRRSSHGLNGHNSGTVCYFAMIGYE